VKVGVIGWMLMLAPVFVRAGGVVLVKRLQANAEPPTVVELRIDETKVRVLGRTDSSHCLYDIEKGLFYEVFERKHVIQYNPIEQMHSAIKLESVRSLPKKADDPWGDPDQVKVEDLGERSLLGRKCRAYRIQAGNLVQEMVVDPSLKLPSSYSIAFPMKVGLMDWPAFGFPQALRILEAGQKIEGFPLWIQRKAPFGVESSMEVLSIREEALPKEAFDMPAGYPLEDVSQFLEDVRKQTSELEKRSEEIMKRFESEKARPKRKAAKK